MRDPRVDELLRRIRELDDPDEAEFGGFTAWDWLACVLGGLLLPALALWWFAA